jgi:hypothetical protein
MCQFRKLCLSAPPPHAPSGKHGFIRAPLLEAPAPARVSRRVGDTFEGLIR